MNLSQNGIVLNAQEQEFMDKCQDALPSWLQASLRTNENILNKIAALEERKAICLAKIEQAKSVNIHQVQKDYKDLMHKAQGRPVSKSMSL